MPRRELDAEAQPLRAAVRLELPEWADQAAAVREDHALRGRVVRVGRELDEWQRPVLTGVEDVGSITGLATARPVSERAPERVRTMPHTDVQLPRQAFSSRDRGCAHRLVMTARAPSHIVTTHCRRRQRIRDFNGPQTSKQWGPFWGLLQREKPAAETGSRFSQIQ